jgi:hypothetical protein
MVGTLALPWTPTDATAFGCGTARAACICNTITWLPTKITMPKASTADLVLAGITDIQQALLKPPPGFHLPPNHVAALKQLTEVLTSVTIPDIKAPSNLEPIALLRVSDHHPTNSSIKEDAPPLRVDTPTPLVLEPTKVHFAPAPSETMQPTFTNSTGIQGQQCHRAQLKRQPLSSSATIHPKRHTRQNPVPCLQSQVCYKVQVQG